MICPAVFTKSHGFHLRWGQTAVLKATASIYPYRNAPSGSTTTFVLKRAPEKRPLGVRSANRTTLLPLRSVPRVLHRPVRHRRQQRVPRREYLPSGKGGGRDHQHASRRRPRTSRTDKSTASVNHPSTACNKMLSSEVSSGLWFTFYLPAA